MKIKAELFEASKELSIGAKDVIAPESEKAALASLAKVRPNSRRL